MRYLTTHTPLYDRLQRDASACCSSSPNPENYRPLLFKTQVLTVAAATLRNYIRQEALKDWLFEKYTTTMSLLLIVMMRTGMTGL